MKQKKNVQNTNETEKRVRNINVTESVRNKKIMLYVTAKSVRNTNIT